MTVARRDANDGPFSDWLRHQKGLDSIVHAIYATDIDMTLYKYKTHVDSVGTRDVKLMMDVEVKTHGAFPRGNQIEALFFRHQLLRNVGTQSKHNRHRLLSSLLCKTVTMLHFGQFVLRLSGGDRPDCCTSIEWLRFSRTGSLIPFQTDEKELVALLGFVRRPDTLGPLDVRRHHATKEVLILDTSGLFPVHRVVVKRS